MNYFHIFYLIFFTFVLENVLNLYTVDEPYGPITVDYSIRCVIDIYNKMDDRSCQFGAKSRQGFFAIYLRERKHLPKKICTDFDDLDKYIRNFSA